MRYPEDWETGTASAILVGQIEAEIGIAISDVTEVCTVMEPVPSRVFLGYYRPAFRHALRSKGMIEYPLSYGVFPYRFDDSHHLLLNGYLDMLEKDRSSFSPLATYFWKTREWQSPNLRRS